MSTLNSWTDLEIKDKVIQAFQELVATDPFLLINDVNERSLTHRLAIYLEKRFPGYHIDCEYNRDGIGTRPKRISEIKNLNSFRGEITTDDDKGVTVFPDIIIHRRGEQSGLVIIEAKKSNSGPNDDKQKLKLYKEDLGYPYAFFIIFPVKTPLVNLDYQTLVEEIE
jgi:hypothetical protein